VSFVNRLLCRDDTDALVHESAAGIRTRLTHLQLLRKVGRLAEALRKHGVVQGDRVLILSGTRAEALESILAAFSIGAAAMPVNPLLGEAALQAILQATPPACAVVEGSLAATIEERLRRSCRLIVTLGVRAALAGTAVYAYERLMLESEEPGLARSLDGDPTALIVYSSGSQALPKAVALSHRQMETFFRYHAVLYSEFESVPHASSGGALISVLPFTHLGGLAIALQALLLRRTAVLVAHFIPDSFFDLVAEAGCNSVTLVPSMYRSLLKNWRGQKMPALRFCISIGEPAPAELAEQVERTFGVTFASAYGLTECLSGVGHSRKDLFGARVKRGSCGTLRFGETKLVDPRGCESDSLGELWIRNPTVHRCYLDEAMNDRRLRDGWFRTGDLFFRDAEGHFFHRGRCDDMFICNGKNVLPGEIEAVLMTMPGVELACAAPVQRRDGGTAVGVLIRANEKMREEMTASAVCEFAAHRGPTYAIPQVVRFIDEFPQTGPGKVDRLTVARLLQEHYDSGRA
jgi:acyl-CoA synthetase (AMP-forming)/AMP-acid ligase II